VQFIFFPQSKRPGFTAKEQMLLFESSKCDVRVLAPSVNHVVYVGYNTI
jgi:hypothetical protein